MSGNFGGPGGTSYSFTCPSGTIASGFSGRGGAWIDGIQMVCSDGSKSPYYGGQGGNPFSETSATGYTGAQPTAYGTYVDGLQFNRTDGTAGTIFGSMTSPNKTASAPGWSCPSGEYINGITGGAGQYLNRIAFTCGSQGTSAWLWILFFIFVIITGVFLYKRRAAARTHERMNTMRT